ncbi:hypothetical protein [Anabaena subtropica]|uniref:Uncharacterized protein n=1 Tax=Anabaena subtropica FACHB-260 TaxID=2692884 RepID=A0ABR8CNB1_9NOST|nr:hypothetical protein [Anabaena subtropica]MBD2343290.1 hypothetical protein [Anabaena subtropica FACHB-260]
MGYEINDLFFDYLYLQITVGTYTLQRTVIIQQLNDHLVIYFISGSCGYPTNVFGFLNSSAI